VDVLKVAEARKSFREVKALDGASLALESEPGELDRRAAGAEVREKGAVEVGVRPAPVPLRGPRGIARSPRSRIRFLATAAAARAPIPSSAVRAARRASSSAEPSRVSAAS